MLGVGLTLLVAVGCIQNAFLAQPASAPRYSKVVNATPVRVAAGLDAGFNSLGLPVLMKRDKAEIRLVGMTSSGDVFCVYVRRAGSAATTAVTVKWDHEPDEQLWEAIVGWLAVCAAQKDGPAKGT
jgi:hypothetical protein